MLKNAEVIKLFVCGNPCYNGSLHVTNVRGIYRLYSYATCICEIDPHQKMCVINTTKYSQTTSRHQSLLYDALRDSGLSQTKISGIPRGTSALHHAL